MRRYVLTGAPGSGKTTLIRALEAGGFPVVEEAATEVNARMMARGLTHPHLEPDFVDEILALQRERLAGETRGPVQFHDRSAFCTYALAVFLGRPVTPGQLRELEGLQAAGVFERRAFFVRNLGFIENTPIRRIDFASALEFERVHEEAYRRFGFELVEVAAAPTQARLELIERTL